MSGRWFRPNFHVESFLRSLVQKSHINHRSELSGDHFQEWAMISSKISCREFLEIFNKKEPHKFTEVSYLETNFMSGRWFRPNFHVDCFLRSTLQESHIIHRSELSGDHFHEWAFISSNFHVECFLRSIVQRSHINHRSELSGDRFQDWPMISSKCSCRVFLEFYSTKEPHQSQKWPIWRPFSWVGDDDFVQNFMSRVSWDL